MKVVFDTNIFVSALLFPGGNGEQALLRVTEGKDRLLVSRPIIGELLEVLARKFARDREELARVAVFLHDIAEIVTPGLSIGILTDEPDNRVLECAVGGRADEIVTGDKQMLEQGRFRGIRIITLYEYLRPGVVSGPVLVARAERLSHRVAVREGRRSYSFGDLLKTSRRRAHVLLGGRDDLQGAPVAYLVAPGFDHVATQWAVWHAGGMAVPLALSHPAPELARMLADARPLLLVADEDLRDRAEEAVETAVAVAWAAEEESGNPRSIELVTPEDLDRRSDEAAGTAGLEPISSPGELPTVDSARRALMVYTSGTTGQPKGVVTTHGNLEAQITTLVDAWEWTPQDHILHVLPLHHIHGIVNALCCALYAGACCEFHAASDAAGIWDRLAGGEVTVFMAVPTMYRRLIAAWEEADAVLQQRWSAGVRQLRLMVSGSAALPMETLERWEAITGHRLLERYGMTEIGMALGNPLHGERRAGTVGRPFAGVEARIVDERGAPAAAGEQGEIEIRGPQVFSEYWGLPDVTEAAFSADGWFRTGDEAIIDDDCWRIIGRRGVDIIKTGGYKVSALEIEARLREHPAVADIAVVGVNDEDWGERVCAAVLAEPGAELAVEDLHAWCKERLAAYKVPKQFAFLADLPRNAMGKVLKPELRRVFTDGALPPEENT